MLILILNYNFIAISIHCLRINSTRQDVVKRIQMKSLEYFMHCFPISVSSVFIGLFFLLYHYSSNSAFSTSWSLLLPSLLTLSCLFTRHERELNEVWLLYGELYAFIHKMFDQNHLTYMVRQVSIVTEEIFGMTEINWSDWVKNRLCFTLLAVKRNNMLTTDVVYGVRSYFFRWYIHIYNY